MRQILATCGIHLGSAQLQVLWRYHQLLRRVNPELNLTRIHNFTAMVRKLYADSMLPALYLTFPSPLLDLGTGAGMPGIPLKILLPDVEIWLAESRRRRAAFLEETCRELGFQGVRVIARSINSSFTEPVAAVVTRALEGMAATLARVQGCLDQGGQVIFMKGPHCDAEIREALQRCAAGFQLLRDTRYRIPKTQDERRLVVFERRDEPPWKMRERAMERHTVRTIDSRRNDRFIQLRKLLGSRGIVKQEQALAAGGKIVAEILRDFPERCLAWVTAGAAQPPPAGAPEGLEWLQMAGPLFEELDIFGTRAPLLLFRATRPPAWDPAGGLPRGCSVLVPFQDPENTGAVIRSAVAFGAACIVLLAESAHPYHPKALRASGGAVLRADLVRGPSIRDLPRGVPIVTLSPEGSDIATVRFPDTFALLPGLEGAGVPAALRSTSVAIPMPGRVESLNGATAMAIALYLWSRQRGEPR
jgi:16S rRNA (guanine527-N7)-methyltransferase